MSDWSLVQAVNSQSPAGNTLTKAFTSVVSSGSIVVGAVLLNTGYTVSVADDQTNPYTVFGAHDDGILYTAAFTSNGFLTNGPHVYTFTATGPATTGNFWVAMLEFTPPTGATLITVDGNSSVFNNAGTSFAALNTSLSDDLVCSVAFSSGAATRGASWNAGAGDTTQVCSEWGIQSGAGSVTMDLAGQSGNMWGPSFAINAGNGGGGGGGGVQPNFASIRYIGWYAALILLAKAFR